MTTSKNVTWDGDSTWTVQIPTRRIYPLLHLKRRNQSNPAYCVVVVQTKPFIALVEAQRADAPSMVIGRPHEWPENDFDGLINLLQPDDRGAPEMPVVRFNPALRTEITRKKILWLISMGARQYQTRPAYIGFTNGRHRARIFEYLEIAAFPVEVHIDNALALAAACGGHSVDFTTELLS